MSQVTITKSPLLPIIKIIGDDATEYDWNHFTTTYDFRVRRAQFTPPYDSVGGSLTLTITSQDASNSAMNTLLDNLTGGNEITIWVGKSDATKEKLFLGIIEIMPIEEPTNTYMDVTIKCPDFGSAILKNRTVLGEWLQKYEDDGVTLDATDTAVLISQIVIDLLTKTQYYPAADFTAEDQGIVVTAANIDPTDIPLSQFTASYESLDDKLADLDKVGNSVHYVDADKNFHMPQANSSTPTGILLVDDYSDAEALTWDQTKVGLIGPKPKTTYSLEQHRRRLFGVGGDQTDQIDQKQETDTTSSSLETNYLAQRFSPEINNVYDIAVKLSKTGSPSLDLTLELIESDSAGEPEGSVLRIVDIDKDAITSTAAWHLFKMSERLNASKNYWIVIRPGGDASNHYNWHRDTATNNVNASSADAVTWTVNTSSFGFTFRQYYSTPLLAICNTDGVDENSLHMYEDVIKEPDVTKKQLLDQILNTECETAFKQKMIFRGMVYAPDTMLKAGDKIRIKKTVGRTYDHDDFVIGRVTYIFESSAIEAVGAFYYEIVASRFRDFDV